MKCENKMLLLMRKLHREMLYFKLFLMSNTDADTGYFIINSDGLLTWRLLTNILLDKRTKLNFIDETTFSVLSQIFVRWRL